MGRIRKRTEPGTPPEKTVWRIGKYIRLSRDDGNDVSESVIHQDQILEDEIPRFFEAGAYEVVDTYIDDGTSGTTDLERRDFQRMVGDLERGRINCVMVKNLSRAFRNSANQGRFLEELIPLYNTRFISLYHPRIDTFLDPEVVHSLEVSITGFMNEQYAYKTSVDVRRTFRYKREKGEFIGAFAPYGYAKDPEDKNALVIDGEAARVVRDIYTWFVSGGMSKAAIARRLNACGIPNPTAYKRGKGLLYANPHAAGSGGLWNPSTIARIRCTPGSCARAASGWSATRSTGASRCRSGSGSWWRAPSRPSSAKSSSRRPRRSMPGTSARRPGSRRSICSPVSSAARTAKGV